MISFYQKYISPPLHLLSKSLFGQNSGCRFTPTCSDYFSLSLKKHGFLKGSIKGLWRIIRCNPFSTGGVDYP